VLLGDRGALAYMMDDQVQAELRDETKASALRKDAEASLGKSALKGGPNTALAAGSARLREAMSNLAFASVVAKVPEAQLKPLVAFLSQASVKAAMQGNAPMAGMFTDKAVLAALHGGNQGIAAVFGDPQFMAAVKGASAALAQAGIAQAGMQQAAVHGAAEANVQGGKQASVRAAEANVQGGKQASVRAAAEANVQGGKPVAMQDAQAAVRQATLNYSFAALAANAAIQAAMRDGTLSALFDPNGKAAMKDVGRLQSALARAQ
jgi:hypothetical protein